jgi:uncharacterized protein (DUF342 family)
MTNETASLPKQTATPEQTLPAVQVSISEDKLAAFVCIPSDPPPQLPLDPETIFAALRKECVVFGLNEDLVRHIAQGEQLDEKIQVAAGTPPQPGEDARIEFKVDLDVDRAPKVGDDGRIDYKNIDFLRNAPAGTVLAVKHQRTDGIPGMSVQGRELSALRGKDKSLPIGSNTYASKDKLQVIAKTDGSISYAGGRISIQPISTISGDVSVETGNIDALGSLKVRGDVNAGYTLKVGGDLEIGGNVMDAAIESGGNVMVKGGFIGQGKGRIVAKGNVTARYVENQTIIAGGDIIIGGEAMNARMMSGNSVYFKGGKSKLVGGECTARNLIWLRDVGNETGTITVARVGYDPKLMGEYNSTRQEIERLETDLSRVKEGLLVLIKLQMDNKLPEAKKPVLEKLKQFQVTAPQQIAALKEKIAELEKKIEENSKAQIAVEGTAYAGAKFYFGLIYGELQRKEERKIYKIEFGKVLGSAFDRSKLKID